MLILKKFFKEKEIHRIFEISLILKGIHAVIEIITSFLILWVTPHFINKTIYLLTQEELTEDPTDIFSNYLVGLSQHFSTNTQLFVFLYLISHGVIKLFLVTSLLKNKLWAYPASMAALFLFIFYQLYRYNITHSIWLILLTIFDVFLLGLTWHEYNFVKKHPRNSNAYWK